MQDLENNAEVWCIMLELVQELSLIHILRKQYGPEIYNDTKEM